MGMGGPIRTDTPQRHRIRESVMWGLTLLTAVTMACINFVQIWFISAVVKCKFGAMQAAVDAYGVEFGVAVLVGTCAVLATLCSCVVQFIEPAAGGSGAPENKGWLNGNPMPGLFTQRTLLVRAAATMLANCAGYPVGREGPTVTMGSNVAYLITHKIGEEYVEKHVGVDVVVSRQREVTTMVIDEERFEHAKRIVCTVGGACGMAMLFDSPIGGIIYMFEEITSVSWPLEVTFRAFAGTSVCALVSKMLLNLVHSDTKNFVIYEWDPHKRVWHWVDMPFFVLLALFMGPVSALHTRACLAVARLRQRAMQACGSCQPWARMAEAIAFAMVCAFTYALVSLLARCEKRPKHCWTEACKELVRYNCEEDMYNPVASLLLTTSEGAVKQLFSQKNSDYIHARNELLCFVAYTTINISLAGVPVPSGNFTGAMLIGGLAGRFWGACVRDHLERDEETYALSGVYAMVGSAAMLSGFKQMAVAVIVFISGCANDPSLVPPLMVSVTVSLLITKMINTKSFDEEQILSKGIPFLPAELPAQFEDEDRPVQALDLCTHPLGSELPASARLPPEAPVRVVEEALACEVDDFPVIDDRGAVDRCIGFATRARLEAAMASHIEDREGEVVRTVTPRKFSAGHDGVTGESRWFINLGQSPYRTPLRFGAGYSGWSPTSSPDRGPSPVRRTLSSDCMVQVAQLAERPPHTVLHDMPGSRMYSLFAKAGVRVASVVDDDGSFCGMVTRKGLIETLRRPPLEDLALGRRRLSGASAVSEELSGLSEDDSDGAETTSLLQVARVGAGGL